MLITKMCEAIIGTAAVVSILLAIALIFIAGVQFGWTITVISMLITFSGMVLYLQG